MGSCPINVSRSAQSGGIPETRKVASVQAAYSGFFETESGRWPCGILWLVMASGMRLCGILQLVMACSKRLSSRLWSVTDSGKQPFGIPHSVQYCLICWTCVQLSYHRAGWKSRSQVGREGRRLEEGGSEARRRGGPDRVSHQESGNTPGLRHSNPIHL